LKSVHALALAAVFAAESALFCAMTGRHRAWIYPRWQGSHGVTFSSPGPHVIVLRAACFGPEKKEGYPFVDRECQIDVAP
jgi:hypothetical protein